MKYILMFIAVITMTACSSTPPAPTQSQVQPQVIVVHYSTPHPATTVLPTTPPAQYYIPIPAAKVYQNPAYIRIQ